MGCDECAWSLARSLSSIPSFFWIVLFTLALTKGTGRPDSGTQTAQACPPQEVSTDTVMGSSGFLGQPVCFPFLSFLPSYFEILEIEQTVQFWQAPCL